MEVVPFCSLLDASLIFLRNHLYESRRAVVGALLHFCFTALINR